MKKLTLLSLVLSFFTITIQSQNPDFLVSSEKGNLNLFNGYKYFYVTDIQYTNGGTDIYALSAMTRNLLNVNGFPVITDKSGYAGDPCSVLYFSVSHSSQSTRPKVYLEAKNCNNKTIYKASSQAYEMSKSLDMIFTKISKLEYFYNENLGLKSDVDITKYSGDYFNVEDINSVRNHFQSNSKSLFEGIWNVTSNSELQKNYKVFVIREGFNYNAYILDSDTWWKPGELKAVFEPTASDEIFTAKWTMANKVSKFQTVAVMDGGILKFSFNNVETILYKVFPKFNSSSISEKKPIISSNWSGNGSGIIISETGYIVTNYHVIENSREIEVEFMMENEKKKFKCEIVLKDKVNDLAVIKIVDINFNGVPELPYNFKTRSSDVGTKVYAFGYPMALNLMGKEIKVTDGIISSKSGLDGDITTYQISATIQPGSSGGPLFDDKGNLIGINSAGLARIGLETTGYSIKSSYVLNLIDVLPINLELPNSKKLEIQPLTEQIKEISKYVVLIKVKK